MLHGRLISEYLSNESRQIHISVMSREKSVLQLGMISDTSGL